MTEEFLLPLDYSQDYTGKAKLTVDVFVRWLFGKAVYRVSLYKAVRPHPSSGSIYSSAAYISL